MLYNSTIFVVPEDVQTVELPAETLLQGDVVDAIADFRSLDADETVDGKTVCLWPIDRKTLAFVIDNLDIWGVRIALIADGPVHYDDLFSLRTSNLPVEDYGQIKSIVAPETRKQRLQRYQSKLQEIDDQQRPSTDITEVDDEV